MKFKEYLTESNLYWICVKLDSKKEPWIAIGFSNEKNADKLVDALENTSDITIFSIDEYGNTQEDKIVKKYKPKETIKNPKNIGSSFIKELRKKLS